MKKFIIIIILVLSSTSFVNADSNVVIDDLGQYFNGYDGCFILYNDSNEQYRIYNESACSKEVSPCSTFKIIHALIGLEENVLKDENTVLKWDGTRYPVQTWNRDQTLQSAIRNSVVWYFEKIYHQVGIDKESFYINKIDYGNRDLSATEELFWLQSSLKISPLEQIEFLKKFYHYQLPFKKEYVDTVKRIIVLSKDGSCSLSGKTGSGSLNGKSINGWFIGYVEKVNKLYFFSTNIQGADRATGYKAKAITLEILKAKGLIE